MPPRSLLDLSHQTEEGRALKEINRFVARLPLKDENDNARASTYYREIAISHRRKCNHALSNLFHEIANQLWN